MIPSRDAFHDLLKETTAGHPILCPEIRTLETCSLVPLWEKVEEATGKQEEPPFWACSWPGGQALARYVLDHPDAVRGRTVLDLGCGNAIAALGAARAGAARVIANDVDPSAIRMAEINAQENGLRIEYEARDLLADVPPVPPVEVILVGDLFYHRAMAARVETWVRLAVRMGASALVGDPGRSYLPSQGLEALELYDVPVPHEIESTSLRRTTVFRMKTS